MHGVFEAQQNELSAAQQRLEMLRKRNQVFKLLLVKVGTDSFYKNLKAKAISMSRNARLTLAQNRTLARCRHMQG